VSIGAAEYEAQQGAPVKLLAMEGIAPTLEASDGPISGFAKNSDAIAAAWPPP
jgi:hypothetical protein